jgi:phospholipid transport system substrate-binding protein
MMEKRMKSMAIKLVLGMLACTFAFSMNSAADQAGAAPAPTARDVMEKITQDVLAILRDPKLSADEKRAKVHDISFENINFTVMGRLCLGRFWRDLNDSQRAEYLQEFREFVANTYGHTIDGYTDEDVKFTGDRQEPDGDWTVQTQITGTKDNKPNQDLAKVDYRLRNQENQWKVIDFTIEGVSLVANFRSQFQEIMTSGGIDQLLKLLHDKNAANDK